MPQAIFIRRSALADITFSYTSLEKPSSWYSLMSGPNGRLGYAVPKQARSWK
jgi:hypothetical protein